jgi:YD repeat-containing protein
VSAAGKTASYGYDANGNLTSQSNPNGTTVTQTFNAADELTQRVNKKSDATTLSQFTYTYNSDGLRSQLNETLGTQTATVTYAYDALHRLKDEVRTGATPYENHFTFDAAGNRLTWNDGFGTTTYTYDAADRLTQAGNTTYTYNANGSRVTKTTSGSTTSYSYDYDEQLTQVASPTTGTSTFTYDGAGRRVTRTAGGTTTTFNFSGNSITTEKQGSTVTAHYVYGVNRISRDASGSYEYYHSDGIGSTRQLSNDTQSVTQTTTYDAFGNVESSAGSSNNVYKYAGQWGYRNDGDDGLMHVGARYYDPATGGGPVNRGGRPPYRIIDENGNVIGFITLPPTTEPPPFRLPWPGLGGTPPTSGPSSPPKPKPPTGKIVGEVKLEFPGPPVGFTPGTIHLEPYKVTATLSYPLGSGWTVMVGGSWPGAVVGGRPLLTGFVSIKKEFDK